MVNKIDFTNEDKLKWMFQYQIDDLDGFIEMYGKIIDPEISFNYFNISIGEYVDLKGKEEYFNYVKRTSAASIFELIDLIASCKGDRFVVYYRQVPKTTESLYQEGVTWFYWMSTIYVRNSVIYKIRSCSNTLNLLQQYGMVILRTNDRERINSYLKTLVKTGLLQDKFIKLEN